jgi:dienelactone hydrolase
MAGPTSNQNDWRPVAERLAAAGYRVLTYNRAGVCDADETRCSDRRGGAQNGWADIVTAAEWVRNEGATKVIVGGASAGAMAALRAAEVAPVIDGVIWMAGGLRGNGYDFNPEDVAQIEAPMLLIASTQDPTTNPDAANLLADWATAPAEVLMLDSELHGTDVLEGDAQTAEQLIAAIERFVGEVAAEAD